MLLVCRGTVFQEEWIRDWQVKHLKTYTYTEYVYIEIVNIYMYKYINPTSVDYVILSVRFTLLF